MTQFDKRLDEIYIRFARNNEDPGYNGVGFKDAVKDAIKEELIPDFNKQIVPAHDCGGEGDCLWCHAQVCYEQASQEILKRLEEKIE